MLNVKTITKWVEEGWIWSREISHEEFLAARNGSFRLLLTPTKAVPAGWLGEVRGKKVLALASGGGQQGPVFAALGADTTVLDLTPAQLEKDALVARRENIRINLVEADMTQPLPFEDGSFDLIFHPVSNVYVETVAGIWRECFRVLRKGGRLLSGLDNGTNFIVAIDDESRITTPLPYNPLKNPGQLEEALASGQGVQFSHGMEENIQGQIDAGFVLKGIYTDTNGEGYLHELNIPTFYATFSEKP